MTSALTRLPSLAAMGLLLFALPGTGLSQTVIPVQVYTLAPNPAPLNSAFTLYLSGESFPCGTVFSRESAAVTGNRIDLTFEADSPIWVASGTESKAVPPICLYDLSATSPVETLSFSRIVPQFKLPALLSGDYEVWATQVYACQFTDPACLVKTQMIYAGKLKVLAPTESKPFYVSPNPVAAGNAFTLNVLSDRYDCGTTFDNLTMAVNGQRISLGFRAQALAGAKCASPVNAYGPAFRLDALAAGNYVIEIVPYFECPPGFACPLILQISLDTLIVTQSASILVSALRAGGLKASFKGAAVDFDLPGAHVGGAAAASSSWGSRGSWRAELLTLQGERLAAGSVRSNGQARATLALPSRPGPGIYLLRLQDATGGVHILPVVRHD